MDKNINVDFRPKPVLIDCDPGHDDAIAILMAVALPELDLLGITTVAGNQSLVKTTRNARVVCGLPGIGEIPIASGADRPLMRKSVTAVVHGESGMDGPSLDGNQAPLDSRHAVELIVDTIEAASEPVTIIAIGPLTNIALTIGLYPHIVERIPSIYMMGGAWSLGNHTPSAEFNIYVDPDAAKAVFNSEIPIHMAGLEITRQAAINESVIKRIGALGSQAGDFVRDILLFYRSSFLLRHGYDGAPIYDACAVAWLARPELVRSQLMHIDVDTNEGPSLGRTVCDVNGVLGLEANVDVGMELQVDSFWDTVLEAISAYP